MITAITASAEAGVSTCKTFHDRRVHPQRLLKDFSTGNTVPGIQLRLPHACYTPTAETLSPFPRPQILRMRLKPTPDFKICLLWLNTVLRRLIPHVSTHDFLLLLLVLPGKQYNDPGVAVRTAVHSRGKRARKKKATLPLPTFFWWPVIGRTSCPYAERSRTCPPTNRPRPPSFIPFCFVTVRQMGIKGI